jgi:hypothetical protein
MRLVITVGCAGPSRSVRARALVSRAALATVLLLGACGHTDRVTEIRVSELAQPSPESQGALERDAALVRKRLTEVAELLGFEEQSSGDPKTIVKFSQSGALAPVELTATSDSRGILVEVSQRAPKTSTATVFVKARTLLQERLEKDFGNRVSQTSRGEEFWSWIRSEDNH